MTRHHRTIAALAVVGALGAFGAAGAQAATKTITAGPPGKISGLPEGTDLNAFFPNKLKVVQGDTVEIAFRGFHTATFPKGQAPSLFGVNGTVSGFNDAAGNPFWFNGQPRLTLDNTAAGPIGDGKIDGKATDSSGIPQGEEAPPFKAKFTKTGSFKLVCLVHPDMKGRVTVLRKGRRGSSKQALKSAVAKQVARYVKTANRLDAFEGPGGANVKAGNDTKNVSLFKFFPRDVTIRAGESVTWRQTAGPNEIHTITFGPEDYLKPIGEAFIAPDLASPPDGPPTLVINPLIAYPSENPAGAAVYDGANHSNGFFNSGIIDDDSASPFGREFRATFSKPGTYGYICMVHGPDMSGKVTVTQ